MYFTILENYYIIHQKGCRMKKTIITSILTFIIASLGVYIFFSYNGTPWEKNQFKAQIETYLKNTYYEKMKINSIGYDIENASFSATVSPVDSSDITFRVWSFRENSRGAICKEVCDNYHKSIYEQEINNDLSQYSSKVFRENCHGTVLFTDDSPFTLKGSKAQKKIPGFLSIREHFTAPIYTLVNVYSDFEQKKSGDEYNKIYQVAKYVFDKYRFQSIRVKFSNNTSYELKYEDFTKIKDYSQVSDFRGNDE